MSQQCTQKDTLFNIKEASVIYDTPKGDVETGYKLIVNEDTNQILSCMTENYQVIKNTDLLNATSGALNERGAILKESRIFGDGARTTWKYRIPDIKLEVQKGDFVNPEIIIKNSYDGSCEASVIAGAYRLVCSNGMVIGYTLGKNSVRHTIWNRNVDIGAILDEVIMSIDNTFSADLPLLLASKPKQGHITKVIEMFPQNQTKNVVEKMISKPPKTYWDLLNAATWVASHTMNRQAESTHRFESKLYPMIHKFAKNEATYKQSQARRAQA